MSRMDGFTLHELMMTLAVAGIAASVAVPRMEGMIRRERVRAALDQVACDLEFARMAGVRGGAGAVFRLIPSEACPGHGGVAWEVVAPGSDAPLRTSPPPNERPACLYIGGGQIAFGSRGLLAPFNNRTVRAVQDDARDSLTVSVVGRVYRRF